VAERWITGAEAEELMRRFERETLDTAFTKLTLWQRAPTEGLYGLLAQHDSLFAVEIVHEESGTTGDLQARKGAEEGLTQALRWYAPRLQDVTPKPGASRDLIEEAGVFAVLGGDYVNIADMHKALGRGLASVIVEPDRRIVRFQVAPGDASLMLLAGMHESALIQRHRVESDTVPEGSLTPLLMPRHTFQDGRIVISDLATLLNQQNLEAVSRAKTRDMRELDGNTDLDGFTLGEFDRFWLGLVTWSCSAFLTFQRLV
jgi:hypothetical protein